MRHFLGGAPTVAAGAGGGGFDPLTLPWAHTYWAEGPDMVALAYANDDPVSSWPDEAASMDLAQTSTTRPAYKSSVAALNSKPGVKGTASNHTRMTATPSGPVAQAFSIVVIAVVDSVWDNRGVYGSTWYENMPSRMWWGEGNRDLRIHAGTTVASASNIFATTAAHLLVGYYNGASSLAEVDGTSVLSGNPSTGHAVSSNSMDTFVLMSDRDSSSYSMNTELAFFGIYSGDVRADGDWAAFEAWAETHYGLTIA